MESLKGESSRLATFNTWPSAAPVQPLVLARAGFYYCNTGSGDRVRCAFCGGVLKKWECHDVPMDEHRKHFPYCQFVRGLEVGNIPAPTAGDVLDNNRCKRNTLRRNDGPPKHPEYRESRPRLDSFRTWPLGMTQIPEILASAGFFYTGANITKCFCCGLELKDWKEGDDPRTVHASLSPYCSFIKPASAGSHGQRTNIIEINTDRRVDDQTVFPHYRDPDERLESFKAIHLLDINPRKHAAAGFFFDSTSDSVRCFCCGLALTPKNRDDENLLDLHARRSSNCPYISNHQGACQCLGLELQNNLPRDQVLHLLQQVTEPTVKGQGVTEAAGGVPFPLHDRRLDPEFLAAENRVLRERMQCRVCHNNHVNIVFLPCGHLVCCSECAPMYSQCPECQRLILARKTVAFE